MTRGCEETKIGWNGENLKAKRLTGEGKQKGGVTERNRLGGDKKGGI